MHLDGDHRAGTADLPPPPPLTGDDSLFLDFDGTLVELFDRPDAVIVQPALIATLRRLADRLEGRIAIVSGRSIAQLDDLLGDVAPTLVIAGSHGAERRLPDGEHVRPETGRALAEATRLVAAFAAEREGLVFERKSFGAGLHYRQAPHLGPEADAFVARLAAENGLVLQRGKMMAEIRIAGDKGGALRALLALPVFAGSRPLFFGDDVTDEDGFDAAAACGGAGVLIGDPRPTAAAYRLANVAALHGWLGQALGVRA